MAEKNNIILDTNFLIYCAKQKIDFVSEIDRICSFAYRIMVPAQVIREMKRLSQKGEAKERKYSYIASQIVDNLVSGGKIEIEEVEAEDADDSMLKLDKRGNIIATLDNELRKKLKNAKLLGIKQFKYLDFA